MSAEMYGSSADALVGPGWLGLRQDADDRCSFELVSALARFDGQLYGGAGLAAAVALVGVATGRPPLWTTTQFVGQARLGERIDCHAEVLAHGGRSSQVRVTATVGDRLVFTALGSAGLSRTDGFSADFDGFPDVDPPAECPPWVVFDRLPPGVVPADTARFGPFGLAEFRQAAPRRDPGLIWARMREGAQTPESMAYLADFVPTMVLRAVGRMGGGTSLDNSVRCGPPPTGPWVLMDVDPYFGHAGYVHGAARVWTPEGRLVAVASQTAVARVFGGAPETR